MTTHLSYENWLSIYEVELAIEFAETRAILDVDFNCEIACRNRYERYVRSDTHRVCDWHRGYRIVCELGEFEAEMLYQATSEAFPNLVSYHEDQQEALELIKDAINTTFAVLSGETRPVAYMPSYDLAVDVNSLLGDFDALPIVEQLQRRYAPIGMLLTIFIAYCILIMLVMTPLTLVPDLCVVK